MYQQLGAVKCWLRSKCPVMNRKDAMVMLAEFEENQKNPKRMFQADWEWWRSIMPDVPEDVLEMMAGFSSEPNPELLPWNRRQRRRHQRSRGLMIHLFSGADTLQGGGRARCRMTWIGFSWIWSWGLASTCIIRMCGAMCARWLDPEGEGSDWRSALPYHEQIEVQGATRTKEGERPWR